MDVQTPDWTGRVVSVVLLVLPGEPWVSNQSDDDGNGYGVDDGSPGSGWTDGSGDDDDGRGFVRRTSGFLIGWT